MAAGNVQIDRQPMADADIGALTAVALMIATPLIGFAYFVLLPFVGIALLFGVLALGLAEKLGWVRK